MKEQAKIKQAVERKLTALLDGKKKSSKTPPEDPEAAKRDMQVLSMAIKYLAVSAKIDESEWGSGLEDLDDDTEPEEPARNA